ncbi:MAG: hypothetical protein IKR60_01545 [Alphaproteobacteria bacterium]|nr:hypothetical protein [Alphaproteobacteria bacterium]
MQSQNEYNQYIGDDNFKKFLAHYECEVPLEVVKMRFAGAICSPNQNLRPTDIISSFWPDGQTPRLETKKEAELFFKFFMGLWDKILEDIAFNHLTLSYQSLDDVALFARARHDELEFGFLEGFWGGMSELKLPAYLADVADSLAELGGVYQTLQQRAQKGEDPQLLHKTLKDTDKMVNKTLAFIVENYALPKIKNFSQAEHSIH